MVTRVGAFLTLYLLYATQPSRPPVPIYLPLSALEEIVKVLMG